MDVLCSDKTGGQRLCSPPHWLGPVNACCVTARLQRAWQSGAVCAARAVPMRLRWTSTGHAELCLLLSCSEQLLGGLVMTHLAPLALQAPKHDTVCGKWLWADFAIVQPSS